MLKKLSRAWANAVAAGNTDTTNADTAPEKEHARAVIRKILQPIIVVFSRVIRTAGLSDRPETARTLLLF